MASWVTPGVHLTLPLLPYTVALRAAERTGTNGSGVSASLARRGRYRVQYRSGLAAQMGRERMINLVVAI
ncbi:hypothetical protein ACVWY3_001513 [Bradyrhizobium sp. USDA 4486]